MDNIINDILEDSTKSEGVTFEEVLQFNSIDSDNIDEILAETEIFEDASETQDSQDLEKEKRKSRPKIQRPLSASFNMVRVFPLNMCKLFKMLFSACCSPKHSSKNSKKHVSTSHIQRKAIQKHSTISNIHLHTSNTQKIGSDSSLPEKIETFRQFTQRIGNNQKEVGWRESETVPDTRKIYEDFQRLQENVRKGISSSR